MCYVKRLRVIVFATIIFLFSACDKQTPDGATLKRQSITDQIAANSNFSILNLALIKAGMEEMLDTPGSFTFFAPNNEVMVASGFDMQRVQQLSSDTIRKILSYHILKSRLFENDFKMGVYYNEITVGGDSSFAIRNEQGLFVNGIKMLHVDFLQSNGIIHVPSKVFHFPQGDLLEVLAVDTSLSLFNAALLKSAKGGTDLTNALVCGCKFTLFAPTNDAFKIAGYPDESSIAKADYKKIIALLSYHITKERVFSTDLVHDMKVQMINGRYVNVFKSANSYMVQGALNSQPIQIIKMNTMATHGIVHAIERIIE